MMVLSPKSLFLITNPPIRVPRAIVARPARCSSVLSLVLEVHVGNVLVQLVIAAALAPAAVASGADALHEQANRVDEAHEEVGGV